VEAPTWAGFPKPSPATAACAPAQTGDLHVDPYYGGGLNNYFRCCRSPLGLLLSGIGTVSGGRPLGPGALGIPCAW